jgi:hypothetical protein
MGVSLILGAPKPPDTKLTSIGMGSYRVSFASVFESLTNDMMAEFLDYLSAERPLWQNNVATTKQAKLEVGDDIVSYVGDLMVYGRSTFVCQGSDAVVGPHALVLNAARGVVMYLPRILDDQIVVSRLLDTVMYASSTTAIHNLDAEVSSLFVEDAFSLMVSDLFSASNTSGNDALQVAINSVTTSRAAALNSLLGAYAMSHFCAISPIMTEGALVTPYAMILMALPAFCFTKEFVVQSIVKIATALKYDGPIPDMLYDGEAITRAELSGLQANQIDNSITIQPTDPPTALRNSEDKIQAILQWGNVDHVEFDAPLSGLSAYMQTHGAHVDLNDDPNVNEDLIHNPYNSHTLALFPALLQELIHADFTRRTILKPTLDVSWHQTALRDAVNTIPFLTNAKSWASTHEDMWLRFNTYEIPIPFGNDAIAISRRPVSRVVPGFPVLFSEGRPRGAEPSLRAIRVIPKSVSEIVSKKFSVSMKYVEAMIKYADLIIRQAGQLDNSLTTSALIEETLGYKPRTNATRGEALNASTLAVAARGLLNDIFNPTTDTPLVPKGTLMSVARSSARAIGDRRLMSYLSGFHPGDVYRLQMWINDFDRPNYGFIEDNEACGVLHLREYSVDYVQEAKWIAPNYIEGTEPYFQPKCIVTSLKDLAKDKFLFCLNRNMMSKEDFVFLDTYMDFLRKYPTRQVLNLMISGRKKLFAQVHEYILNQCFYLHWVVTMRDAQIENWTDKLDEMETFWNYIRFRSHSQVQGFNREIIRDYDDIWEAYTKQIIDNTIYVVNAKNLNDQVVTNSVFGVLVIDKHKLQAPSNVTSRGVGIVPCVRVPDPSVPDSEISIELESLTRQVYVTISCSSVDEDRTIAAGRDVLNGRLNNPDGELEREAGPQRGIKSSFFNLIDRNKIGLYGTHNRRDRLSASTFLAKVKELEFMFFVKGYNNYGQFVTYSHGVDIDKDDRDHFYSLPLNSVDGDDATDEVLFDNGLDLSLFNISPAVQATKDAPKSVTEKLDRMEADMSYFEFLREPDCVPSMPPTAVYFTTSPANRITGAPDNVIPEVKFVDSKYHYTDPSIPRSQIPSNYEYKGTNDLIYSVTSVMSEIPRIDGFNYGPTIRSRNGDGATSYFSLNENPVISPIFSNPDNPSIQPAFFFRRADALN